MYLVCVPEPGRPGLKAQIAEGLEDALGPHRLADLAELARRELLDELGVALRGLRVLDFLQLDVGQLELVGDDRLSRKRDLEELDVALGELHDLAARLARRARAIAARGRLGG